MTLAIDKLIEYSDICPVIHNSKLIWALKEKCNAQYPTFDDINYISSLILSGITSPFRLISEPNTCSNLKKFDRIIRPYPRLHFLNISFFIFMKNENENENESSIYNDHNISIINGCWWDDVSDVRQKMENY